MPKKHSQAPSLPLLTLPTMPGADQLGQAYSIDVARIRSHPEMLRQHLDPLLLADLTASIHQHGVIQPIIVRYEAPGYMAVTGNLRLKAARMANLPQIPCLVRDVSDDEVLLLSIIENVQRVPLDPLDEARALQRLSRNGERTLRELADLVHKSYEWIRMRLRLLDDPEVIEALETGRIGVTVAHELRALPDPAQRAAYLTLAEQGEPIRVETVRQAKRIAAAQGTVSNSLTEGGQPDLVSRASGKADNLRASIGTLVASCSGDALTYFDELLRLGAEHGWSCAHMRREINAASKPSGVCEKLAP